MGTIKRAACALLTLALCAGLAGCATDGGGGRRLTFQIWDNTQKAAMEAICAALDCQPGDILEFVPDEKE